MKKIEIQKMLKQSNAKKFTFKFSNFIIDEFCWTGTNENCEYEDWETMNIHQAQLSREQIEELLESDIASAVTSKWEGTKIESHGKEICEPTYGMGDIYISIENILAADSIWEKNE